MDTTLVEQLDEKKCKILLDFCAKRAYGKSAKFMLVHGYPMVNVREKDFYLLLFGTSNADLSKTHDKSYKTVLKNMMSSLKLETDYISYLNNQPHFLDGNMSIENILVEADLMEFNNE